MKIVIVDNEPTILRSLELLIEPKADAVNCFTNPGSALRYIKHYGHSIDILFTDYFMPDMNGLDLIVRSVPFLKPETLKVIMSGHIELIPPLRNEKWPVDHLLSKPFDLDQLLYLLTLPHQAQLNEQLQNRKKRR